MGKKKKRKKQKRNQNKEQLQLQSKQQKKQPPLKQSFFQKTSIWIKIFVGLIGFFAALFSLKPHVS